MRFRGKIVDIGCIHHFTSKIIDKGFPCGWLLTQGLVDILAQAPVYRFYRVIGTLSKLIKTCVLRITSGNWYFILSERAVNGGIQIWSELPQGHFFDEYAMEGVSEEDNEIFLELAPENLMKALKTAQSAKWLKIKLTKKHTPCLTVEVDLPTLSAHSRTVVHDIPVTVIPRRLWTDFEEPELPHFDVSVVMPHLKLLRNVVEKMKNLSNFVVLSANQMGEMKLMVETDMVSISTHFKDLINPTSRDPMMNPSQEDPQTFYKTRIDIRKLSQFLASQQFNPTRVICNVVNNRTVHFLLLQDDVSLQYFMPVIAS